MILNYFTIAFRNLRRNAFYTIINIAGLSIGLLAAILILIYLGEELGYDRHHENHDRIYRLESFFTIAGKEDQFAVTSIPLATVVTTEYPEVIEMVRFMPMGNGLLKYKDTEVFEEDIFLCDSTVFDIFSHPFLLGESEGALTRPNTIVITKSMQQKLFGNVNPVGEIIQFDERSFQVKGVIEDLPDNSHLKFSGLVSAVTIAEEIGLERFNDTSSGAFWNISVYSYILLAENAPISNVLDNWQPVYEKYMAELGNQINSTFVLRASPLTRIHLYSQLEWDLPTGNYVYVYIFGIVATFILIIACINYMNLATSRSFTRAREVGLRKVLGAVRTNLLIQFLSESLLITVFALAAGLILAVLILPVFNDIAGKSYTFLNILQPQIIAGSLLITAAVGLLSGSYPAFYLSSFQPAFVLRSRSQTGGKSGILRKILVVVQFTISITMIIGTFTVNRQINHIQNKDLGFEKENLMVLSLPDSAFAANLSGFQEKLKSNPKILGSATSNSVPGTEWGKIVFRIEDNGTLIEKPISLVFIDENWVDLMGMEFISGRNYDTERGTDLNEAFIINESAAIDFGWANDALGKRMQFGIELDGSATRDGSVVGVLKDFNYGSLHNPVAPVALLLGEFPNHYLSIRVAGDQLPETISFIKSEWESMGASQPFSYRFISDILDESYQEEKHLGTVFMVLAVIIIFISCLGLFALAAFISEQRTKEIGIRKVMGASIQGIIFLLSWDFVRLVLLSSVLAVPCAYFALKSWLQNFAYQAPMSAGLFIAAGMIAMAIALLTVASHALRAAMTNPVDAIKWE